MGLPKKASRRIHTEGDTYLWMIRDNGDHYVLAIQLETGEGQKLIVTFRVETWINADGYANLKVAPGDVVDIIKEGKIRGWKAHSLGSPQTFNIRDGDELLRNIQNEQS